MPLRPGRKLNGVAIDWEVLAAQPPPGPPLCPYCGETRLVEVAGRAGFCNVCAKAFTLPKR